MTDRKPIEDIREAFEPDYPPKPDISDRGWDEVKEEHLEKKYPIPAGEKM